MNSKLLQSTSPSNHPILFRVKAVLWGLVEGASTSFVFFWVALVVTYAFMIMVHNSWNSGGSTTTQGLGPTRATSCHISTC